MARGRMLSRSLGCSRRFTSLPDVIDDPLVEFAQLLFVMIIPHVDDYGRMTADPRSVKLSVLPASSRPEADFTRALEALHTVELITVYTDQAENWLQVNKFEYHQRGLSKRTASRIAPPPKTSREFPANPGNYSLARARGTELRTELKDKNSAASPAAPPPPRLPVDNLKVITKVAHEVLKAHLGNGARGADLCDEIKTLCATRHIAYDAAVVRKALDSAEVQRKVKRA